MIRLLFFLTMIASSLLYAHDMILDAHYRPRPPEMTIDAGGNLSGPLKDIIELAAERIGYRVDWYQYDFQDSYICLIKGCVDIVPRVIYTEKRRQFVNYLGPIGYQQKDILFVVPTGKQKLISKYEDLYHLHIGAKKKAAYFTRFNNDSNLSISYSDDDENLSKMFASRRLDTLIVLDPIAFEKAMEMLGIKNYTYADYRHKQYIGNYFGMSKKSQHREIFNALNQALKQLVDEGKAKEIYLKYGLTID